MNTVAGILSVNTLFRYFLIEYFLSGMSRSAQPGRRKSLSSLTLPSVFSSHSTFYSGIIFIIIIFISIIVIIITITFIIISTLIIIFIIIIFISISIITTLIIIIFIIFITNLIIPRLVGTENFLGFCFELNSVISQPPLIPQTVSHLGFVRNCNVTYLIFVTGTTGGARGEQICHVEKFFHMTECHVDKFST